ncbi:hypothetical protein HYPSUDRAFT_39858 [Hypholoma sublateritium FD-334 SS-4]|uniref:CASP-like protein n=1 Tax=Hypholoma sublateritium (strain FD-334 SS-4) TaxID=945553 RepID=A0A0D2PUW1_HYPSF|nr:hypothetical protein HYPSUDRAFT_39858 [Hypholoma sublateritium FD-334 SS-4]
MRSWGHGCKDPGTQVYAVRVSLSIVVGAVSAFLFVSQVAASAPFPSTSRHRYTVSYFQACLLS